MTMPLMTTTTTTTITTTILLNDLVSEQTNLSSFFYEKTINQLVFVEVIPSKKHDPERKVLELCP